LAATKTRKKAKSSKKSLKQSKADMIEEIHILRELRRRYSEPLRTFKPYAKQQEFYQTAALYPETCLMAGNQVGKTKAAAQAVAYHLTGKYPDWWEGPRFDEKSTGWVCGETGEVIRDTMQKYLFGRPGEFEDKNNDNYTGIIPKRHVMDYKKAQNSNGLLDYVKVMHKSGFGSYVFFKAYAKGREKFQGDTIDWILFDEEPPPTIYSEGLTRTNNGQNGRNCMLTFTPLKGMSEIVYKFLRDPGESQAVVNMTIDDAEHYSAEEKAAIIASYPAHERKARAEGLPIMGSGLVFQVAVDSIVEPRIDIIPGWWRQIIGIDFGWDHPAAAAWLLYDPDKDIIHVRATYKARETTPIMFAQVVKKWGKIPVAWPHDGLQHDKGSGNQLAMQYQDAGLQMLPDKATFSDGSNGVEAGVMEMLQRMQSGRLVVDENCQDFFDEMRLYHRKDGVIQKIMDDTICAVRYGMMMMRYAAQVDDYITESMVYPEADATVY